MRNFCGWIQKLHFNTLLPGVLLPKNKKKNSQDIRKRYLKFPKFSFFYSTNPDGWRSSVHLFKQLCRKAYAAWEWLDTVPFRTHMRPVSTWRQHFLLVWHHRKIKRYQEVDCGSSKIRFSLVYNLQIPEHIIFIYLNTCKNTNEYAFQDCFKFFFYYMNSLYQLIRQLINSGIEKIEETLAILRDLKQEMVSL